jgi:hypothetical protein
MVIIFSIMLLLISDISNTTDRIVLKEECSIIANNIANHLSDFSNEIYMTNQTGTNSATLVQGHVIYLDLPEFTQGKQYKVDISDANITTPGNVIVTYVGNSNVYSNASYKAMIKVNKVTFYSTQGRYYVSSSIVNGSPVVDMGANA